MLKGPRTCHVEKGFRIRDLTVNVVISVEFDVQEPLIFPVLSVCYISPWIIVLLP